MSTKLIVALDTTDISKAEHIVKELKDLVYAFKVGPYFFLSHGYSALETVSKEGCRIFLDLKFFDIPSIVRKSVKNISGYNIVMFTVHCLGGYHMMKSIADYIESSNLDMLPLGVTVLTSMGEEGLKNIGINSTIQEEVIRLAYLAKKSGIKGLVCSAQEVQLLRKEFGDFFKLVTPGIRLCKERGDDQFRIFTPGEAAEKGADYIVMGRPVMNSKQPKKLVEEINEAIV